MNLSEMRRVIEGNRKHGYSHFSIQNDDLIRLLDVMEMMAEALNEHPIPLESGDKSLAAYNELKGE